MLKPIKNTVLFMFDDDVRGGRFHEITSGGIILPTNDDRNVKDARWGVVTAVGPEVDDDIAPGDKICIEPLAWTEGLVVEGVKVWKTSADKILLHESMD